MPIQTTQRSKPRYMGLCFVHAYEVKREKAIGETEQPSDQVLAITDYHITTTLFLHPNLLIS